MLQDIVQFVLEKPKSQDTYFSFIGRANNMWLVIRERICSIVRAEGWLALEGELKMARSLWEGPLGVGREGWSVDFGS